MPKVVENYCGVAELRKILLIWNDVESPIPPQIQELKKRCGVELQFIKSEKNKMTNRFLPRNEIETDCELHSMSTIEGEMLTWQK